MPGGHEDKARVTFSCSGATALDTQLFLLDFQIYSEWFLKQLLCMCEAL
jgi:hypothetical protein